MIPVMKISSTQMDPIKNPKILLCESDDLVRKILANQLMGELNAEVYEADNGKTALKILSMKEFSLVITNKLLPIKSGLEIVEYVRNELESKVPIVLIASDDEEHTMIEAYKMGVDDFMNKPINPVELGLRANYLISKK
jgi:DNA-binding response OmpR family regulator